MTTPTAAGQPVTPRLRELRRDDPYRWLEDGDDPAVRQWQEAQNARTAATLLAWPQLAAVRDVQVGLTGTPVGPLPVAAGGRWFRLESPPTGSRLVVAPDPFGGGDVVVDAAALGAPTPTLVWSAPSPDGRLAAVGVCRDGSERNAIHLVEVQTGRVLPAPSLPLMDGLSGGLWWLPDSNGFCFSAVNDADGELVHDAYLHRLDDGSTRQLEVPWTTAGDYRCVRPSRDGRWLVAIERILEPVPVAVAPLSDPADLRWRRFVVPGAFTLAGHLLDHRFVGITDHGAPRGRVVQVDLEAPDPADWITLVRESKAVLRRIDVVGDQLVLGELVDTWSRLRVVGLDGSAPAQLPLPGRGAVREGAYPYLNLLARPHQDEYLFAFSTPTTSSGVYRWRPGSPTVDELLPPDIVLDGAVVDDLLVPADDGVMVPCQLVRRCDTEGPVPTLVYAYGAFGTPVAPGYSPTAAAIVSAGGAYVLAHPRGGGELGREWWESARFSRKQRTYDDVYAVAEWLLAQGHSDVLAVTGESAGGILAAVAAVQRPDLWAAAVARVPATDLLANADDAYGRLVLAVELADISDEGDVEALRSVSPYALATNGQYPATLVLAGETDPRCPPWHARKFVARMLANQLTEAPVLLSVHLGAGHGLANAAPPAIDAGTQAVAFLMMTMGLVPVGRGAPAWLAVDSPGNRGSGSVS